MPRAAGGGMTFPPRQTVANLPVATWFGTVRLDHATHAGKLRGRGPHLNLFIRLDLPVTRLRGLDPHLPRGTLPVTVCRSRTRSPTRSITILRYSPPVDYGYHHTVVERTFVPRRLRVLPTHMAVSGYSRRCCARYRLPASWTRDTVGLDQTDCTCGDA